MERNGRIMISPEYSVYDYKNLNLTCDSNEYIWKQAIEMIRNRFEDRFFSTISYLDGSLYTHEYNTYKVERNGFAIMALNCLLIDTFYQFEYGLETSGEFNSITNDKGVGTHYKSFLKSKFPDLFNNNTSIDLASLFYDNIRCGILHSAQTKGCSMLSCDYNEIIGICYDDDGKAGIIVNVPKFSRILKEYFYNDYLSRLINGHNSTRKAFINKMQFVCEI